MNITKLNSSELNALKNELKTLRDYLNSMMSGYSISFFESKFLNLLNNQIFITKTDLSTFLNTASQPTDFISNELYKFFSNYNKKNNHYVQNALLKHIISSSKNLEYISYSLFYHNFRNIANNSKSNEFNIFNKLKNNYAIGIKEYFNYFINSTNKPITSSNVSAQPQTYFINNYTESLLNTSLIEQNFISGLKKKSLSEFQIIQYFCLHYSRRSILFLSAIKSLYIKLNKTNPISFNDYCIMQFYYHLSMITSYCNELECFINQIDTLIFSVKSSISIIFSDTIDNLINHRGYTGIFINEYEILTIENKTNIFNNQEFLYDSFFNAQEFVGMDFSQKYLLNEPNFQEIFKKKFYNSIFPVNIHYTNTNSIQKKFKSYLNDGYFLHNFKCLSKKFEI